VGRVRQTPPKPLNKDGSEITLEVRSQTKSGHKASGLRGGGKDQDVTPTDQENSRPRTGEGSRLKKDWGKPRGAGGGAKKSWKPEVAGVQKVVSLD